MYIKLFIFESKNNIRVVIFFSTIQRIFDRDTGAEVYPSYCTSGNGSRIL